MFTEELFKAMEEILGIPNSDLYVNIFEMPAWDYRGRFW
jgi:hypothetical protein